ncbi:MAG TPA: PEGA domain-containing protein, partial [Candidatus Acidoferrum sp.]|nr:PEGA domain-containing protein [Candidatus Acidoferrum sp.]
MSRSLRIMGKWRYMSPEQALGEALGTRSDLFSAAAVWFEMFTGEKLFPGDEADQIIDHICHMPIPSASDRRRGLPPRLDDVLRQALERDPDRRPDKASDVLRALVEISYESSIVATALDVAAAVQEALEATARLADGSLPPRPLDEHIRGQLQPLDESVRLTAVGNAPAEGEPGGAAGSSSAMPRADGGSNGEVGRTSHAPSEGMTGEHSTGITLVKRGVDPDGVTHWELDADAVGGEDTDRLTMAAAPAALRTGRRPSDAPPSTAEDEEEERVAGPRLLRRAARVALFALVTAGGGAALAWQMGALGSEPDRRAPAAVRPPAEAATLPAAATLAVLVIDSIPSGARVRLDGRQLPEPTPTSAEIAPRVAHVVELEREGYRRYVDEGVSSRSGETVRITPPLLAERASLSVITVPPGAEVSLDGEVLGETPLHRDDLRPGRDRRLTLRKQDFKPIDLTVEMVDGLRSEIKKRLESAIVHGRIMINLPDTWADVSDSGKRVGRVGIGTSGVLRLPVGHHRLKFYNRESKRERMVEVEVVAGEDRLYNVEL